MNLRQLQYFKTIAELEHYTRAAEKLYVSQSNLSHSIQELEDELNVEFFVRKGRNIKLTKYGELFLPYVSQALNLLDTGVARLQDYINPNSGTVVMACFPSLAEFAPELIVRYLSETNRVGERLQINQEATFMQLRPIMSDDGTGGIMLFEKARGTKNAIDKLVNIIGAQEEKMRLAGRPKKPLCISHCNCPELAVALKKKILEKCPGITDVGILPTGGLSTFYAFDGGIVVGY